MAVSSLRQVITGNFVKNLASQSKASNASATFNASSKDAASLDISLRTGARNLAQGLQAINVGATYLTLSRNTNERLLDVVTQMDLVVSKAGKSAVGSQTGSLMQQEFQALITQFQKVVRESKLQGNDVLDVEALSEVMIRSGLDPEVVDDLGGALKKITPPGGASSDAIASSSESVVSLSSFASALRRTSAEFSQAEEAGLSEEAVDAAKSFKQVRSRLADIRKSLEGNIKALDKAVEVVGKNLALVRAAGFAMLDLSSEIKGNEDPEDIARRIQDRVRRGAPGAMDQANNLNSVMIAGFSLNPDTFKSISKKSSE